MGAVNGVFVNNIRVETHKLEDGDIIQLGGIAKTKISLGEAIIQSDSCAKYTFHLSNIIPPPSIDNNNNSNQQLIQENKTLKQQV